MTIVQSINNVNQFREAFRLAGRMDQFSYEGLEVLFDYLDNLSEDTGETIELDPVALCCEYYESSIEELIDRYNLHGSYVEGDENEIKAAVEEFLQDSTTICGETKDGFVYAAF